MKYILYLTYMYYCTHVSMYAKCIDNVKSEHSFEDHEKRERESELSSLPHIVCEKRLGHLNL